ncbi:MAG: hypothetical protein M3524_01975 [Actinomycetota bacterium]|nr:hypothetical protein [Actinomycetota bacterium]
MWPRLAVVGFLVACLALGGGETARASCAGPFKAFARDADQVFVGTVSAQRRGYTQFMVEQVWRGPDLAPQVWLLSGTPQAPWPISLVLRTASSADADLVAGRRYVVATEGGDRFHTNACIVHEATPRLIAALAPENTRGPVSSGLTGLRAPLSNLVVSLAGLVGVAGLFVLGMRRRAARPR